jgi:hypothetical protein
MKVEEEANAMKLFQSQTAKNIIKPTVRVQMLWYFMPSVADCLTYRKKIFNMKY